MDKQAIIPILREVCRIWDPRVLEGYQNYGIESLIRQDAHRVAQTLALFEEQQPPERLLEIGTGYLGMAVPLRRRFPAMEIVGVEYPGRRYIWTREYRDRLAMERIRLVATDVVSSGLPFRTGTFGGATLAEVVEHLPPNTLPTVLAEVARVLCPGGTLILTTPNLASWMNREYLLRGDSPGQQSPALIIDGCFGHLRLYTMHELVTLLEGVGFRVVRQRFIDQIPLGISRIRRLIRLALRIPKTFWPALRDTCVIHAVRS